MEFGSRHQLTCKLRRLFHLAADSYRKVSCLGSTCSKVDRSPRCRTPQGSSQFLSKPYEWSKSTYSSRWRKESHRWVGPGAGAPAAWCRTLPCAAACCKTGWSAPGGSAQAAEHAARWSLAWPFRAGTRPDSAAETADPGCIATMKVFPVFDQVLVLTF